MSTQRYSLTRRRFLQYSGVSLLSLGLPATRLFAGTSPIISKKIPSSGELIPVIGMGTSRTFNVEDNPALMQQLQEVLQIFFDQGGRLIDSSPMYGNAETVVGELLKKVTNKDKLFAATKVWTNGKQEGIAQMQESMRLMGVPRMDLMQIHNLVDWQTHLETLQQWKAQGKIRYIGVTTSHGRDHEELESILRQAPIDFVQFSYNIANRAVEYRLLPLAKERSIATLINRPFRRGDLFKRVKGKPLPEWAKEFDCSSWGQFFLKFVASHPDVTCVIPATSKPKHMLDNMQAGYGRLPDDSMRQRMIKYFKEL